MPCKNSYLRKSEDFTGLATLPLFLSIRAAIRSMVAVQTISGTVVGDMARDGQPVTLSRPSASLPPRHHDWWPSEGSPAPARPRWPVASLRVWALLPAPSTCAAISNARRCSASSRWSGYPTRRISPTSTATSMPGCSTRRSRSCLPGTASSSTRPFSLKLTRQAVIDLGARLRVPFDGLWLGSDPATLERRIAARTADASDADVEVLHRQLERGAGPMTWTEIDAGGELDQVVALVDASLSGH